MQHFELRAPLQPSPVERMAAVAFYAGVALAAGALAAVAFILS